MMKVMRASLRAAVLLGLLAILAAAAYAQGNNLASLVVGDAIVSVTHGTPRADVEAVAASVKGQVLYAFGPLDYDKAFDVYQIRVNGIAGADDTLGMIDKIKQDPRVKYAGPNRLFYPAQTTIPKAIPNDPRFNEQWDKVMIRCPEAWTIEKGQSNVIIAVVDTGVDIDHPEFAGRFLPGYNSFNQTNDPRPNLTAPGTDHGTHVAGIAMAQADNAIGVAGVVWQNVKLLPVNAANDSGVFPFDSLARAFQFVLTQHNANSTSGMVLNLSLGAPAASDTPDPNDPFNASILNLAKSGIVVCAGAGNSFTGGNPPFNPANLAQLDPRIICVSAVNHLGGRAYYSEARNYTTIAAPGGDVFAGKQILSTIPVAHGSYGEEQGTSMATPQVTGAVALLLSIPGVGPDQVKSVLTSTAQPVASFAVPSPEFGAGILDVYAALLKVAVTVTILEPAGTGGKASQSGAANNPDPVETLRPTFHIQVAQITPDKLVIKVDGTTITNYQITNILQTTKDQSGNTVPLRYDVVFDFDVAPGQHKVDVSGTSPGGRAVSDTRTITVQPHVVSSGRSMISIPYYYNVNNDPNHPIDPQNYFGNSFRLARWVPDKQAYAFDSSFGSQDPFASFNPPDVKPHKDGDPTPIYPLGLGYWSDSESIKPVLTRGKPIINQAVVIPLKGNGSGDNRFVSWNMLGDPFPFDVPFNSLLVDAPEGRLSIGDAVSRGYILPNIYSFDGQSGYTFRTLPDGSLRAWTGHWVGVTSRVDIALVVPPARTTRAASITPRTPGVGGDGWTIQIGANTRDLHDTFNFVGVSTRAADTYNSNDVQKPPMVSPYVSLGVNHDDWGAQSGLYAQDLRSVSGVKTWNVIVNTDQPESDVLINWTPVGSLPRNLKLTLKDESTGQVVDMRTRSSFSFNTGAKAGTRRFTLTARPSTGAVVRITNVAVRSDGRAAGTSVIGFSLTGDATYEVKVLNAAGQSLGVIASRAAGAGDHRVVWQGKDTAGRSVPAGTYLVQIRAVGSDGDSVKVVQPFAVLR